MFFSDIIGQEEAIGNLRSHIRSGDIPHAMIFTGPSGVGKRSTAMAVAAAVNCTEKSGEGDSCGHCASCSKVKAGSHPDIHLLMSRDRAEESGASGHILTGLESDPRESSDDTKSPRVIRIAVIRDLELYMNRKPMEEGWKIAIIADADQLTVGATGALLKTLEEPPGDSLIILTTASPSRLPDTIRSRCRNIRFTPIPEETASDFLSTKHGMDRERAKMLVHLSQGSIGKALRMEENKSTDFILEAVARVSTLHRMNATDTLTFTDKFCKSVKRTETASMLLALLDIIEVYFRDSATGIWSEGWNKNNNGGNIGAEPALSCFEFIEEARKSLNLNVNPQLVMEAMFMNMRSAARAAARSKV